MMGSVTFRWNSPNGVVEAGNDTNDEKLVVGVCEASVCVADGDSDACVIGCGTGCGLLSPDSPVD